MGKGAPTSCEAFFFRFDAPLREPRAVVIPCFGEHHVARLLGPRPIWRCPVCVARGSERNSIQLRSEP